MDLNSWFKDFADSYLKYEKIKTNVLLKRSHTFRVALNIRLIAESLDLDEKKKDMFLTIAYLHDIGRFEQLRQFATFSDEKSIDHGNLSKEIVIKKNLLNGFSEIEKKQILQAIEFHNDLYLPDLPDDELLFVKAIRDADKLDIFYVYRRYFLEKAHNLVMDYGLSDEDSINPDLVDTILCSECGKKSQLKYVNDLKLLILSWVFTLNFRISYTIVDQEGYVLLFLGLLPEFDKKKKLEKHVIYSLSSNLKGESDRTVI